MMVVYLLNIEKEAKQDWETKKMEMRICTCKIDGMEEGGISTLVGCWLVEKATFPTWTNHDLA